MDTEILEKMRAILKSFDDLDTAKEQYYSRFEIGNYTGALKISLLVRNNTRRWGAEEFFTRHDLPYTCEKLEQMQQQLREAIDEWKKTSPAQL